MTYPKRFIPRQVNINKAKRTKAAMLLILGRILNKVSRRTLRFLFDFINLNILVIRNALNTVVIPPIFVDELRIENIIPISVPMTIIKSNLFHYS